MNQLLKLEVEKVVMHYRRGSLDIEGEEIYRNWIASKCSRIPRDDFKAVVALLLVSPPRLRPSYKTYYALWKKVQADQAAAYREKVRNEKKDEPPRFVYSEGAWELLRKEIDYLAKRKKGEEGDPDVPFI